MPSVAKTSTQLELASNKLEYHIVMYVRTYEWLRARESPPISSRVIRTIDTIVGWIFRAFGSRTKTLVANSIEESNAVHARILIEFLIETRETDVEAKDYFPGTIQNPNLPLPRTFLHTEKKEIEQKLIHLTIIGQTQRIDQITWSRDAIARQLERELRSFFSTVPPEHISHLRSVDKKSCVEYLDRLKAALP